MMANSRDPVVRSCGWSALPQAESSDDSQEGAVTAEFAIAVPAILMLLAVAVSFFTLAVEQLRLNDVAFMSARAIARGEKQPIVEHYAMKLMGKEVTVEVSADSEVTQVRISCESNVLSLPWLSLRLQAQQKVIVEEKFGERDEEKLWSDPR